jgi:hypothetical protein
MNLTILGVIILAFAAGHAKAIDLAYGSLDPNNPKADNAILLTGEVRKGDLEVLKQFAANDRERFHWRTIVLASQGGDLLEAMRIGQFIRETYMEVFVNPDVGRCASACFFIYVSAIQRDSLDSGLGIHRPYFSAADFDRTPLNEVEHKHRQLMKAVRNYLEDQQVPAQIIEKMFSLASSEIYWLTHEDIASLGRRAHWWDQVLVDRCMLNKELELELLSRGDFSPRAAHAKRHIREVAECAYNISADDRLKNLNRLLRQLE